MIDSSSICAVETMYSIGKRLLPTYFSNYMNSLLNAFLASNNILSEQTKKCGESIFRFGPFSRILNIYWFIHIHIQWVIIQMGFKFFLSATIFLSHYNDLI